MISETLVARMNGVMRAAQKLRHWENDQTEPLDSLEEQLWAAVDAYEAESRIENGDY